MENYVLVGFSGLTGSQILRNLVDDPSVSKVVCIGRKNADLDSLKVSFIQISSLEDLKKIEQMPTGAHWICCLGTTIKTAGSKENFLKVDLKAVIDFANLAKYSMPKSLSIISATGANKSSAIFYNQVKGQMEEAVMNLNLPYVNIFRPGLLIGDRKEFRLGEKMMIELIGILRHFMPEVIFRKIATPIDQLAVKIIQESRSQGSGFKIFESDKI